MPERPRVLVIGATGTTGSRLVRRLRAVGCEVRPASRTAPAETDGWVRFDWLDEATHARALDGIDRMYLIPPLLVADPSAAMTEFLERALETGVQRVVLLSASAIPEGTPGVGAVHAAVRREATEWAVLQPTWFAQNFVDPHHHHGASIRREGAFYTAAGDGRVPFVDADDIAAVAAHALTDETPHNRAHVITGPRAMTHAEAAAVLSEANGREVRHVPVSADEASRRMVAAGIPESFAPILAQLEVAIGQGAEDRVTDTVLAVTGRPPRTFAEVVSAQSGG